MIENIRRAFKYLLMYLFLIAVPGPNFVFAQALQPQPELQLLEAGWGAAATGMGGAYVGVAEDLSAIYWNPGGLAQTYGLQVYGEYSLSGDIDEDYAAEVFANRFESAQRFSGDGNQFDFIGVAYGFNAGSARIVPAFAWHKNSGNPLIRELKESAGLVDFLTPRIFIQSEGTFTEELKDPGEEFSFALAAAVHNQIMIGGTLNFSGGTSERSLTGQFHDTLSEINGPPTVTTDITLNQTLEQDTSGTSIKIGLLFVPSPAFKFGGTMRFPFTRTTDLNLIREGTIVSGNSSQPLQESATAESEVEVPFEVSFGASAFLRGTFRLAGSVTYSDWADTQQVTRESTNTRLIPNDVLPYPSLRANALPQNSLLQLRGGLEYIIGQPGNGLMLRAGIFRDGQPYGDQGEDRTNLDGYSFGVGYISSGFGIDAAFTREKGDFVLTSTSKNTESKFSFRRFLISFVWAST